MTTEHRTLAGVKAERPSDYRIIKDPNLYGVEGFTKLLDEQGNTKGYRYRRYDPALGKTFDDAYLLSQYAFELHIVPLEG